MRENAEGGEDEKCDKSNHDSFTEGVENIRHWSILH